MLPGYIAGHYGFDEVHIDLGCGRGWRARARFARVLHERGVEVHVGCQVVEVVAGAVRCAGGAAIGLDEILWSG